MVDHGVRGVSAPQFLYGTAWKEDRTEALTYQALVQGFRGIDTANQRRHYFEAAVGDGLARYLRDAGLAREDIFLQTKFTYRAGQDQRLPYDPAAPVDEQVRQSFQSSLEHLQTSYIDSYVLHGPSKREGLGSADRTAWQTMEELQRSGKARLIGVSNVSLAQLELLYAGATIKPAFVQNRCYAVAGWDREVRAFCRERGVVYQGFSLLTANSAAVKSKLIGRIAERLGRSPEQVVFRFALQAGMLPLTGTSSERHMQDDLRALEFELDDAEIDAIERTWG